MSDNRWPLLSPGHKRVPEVVWPDTDQCHWSRITLDSLSFSKHFSLGRGGGPERTVFGGLVVETEFFHAGPHP